MDQAAADTPKGGSEPPSSTVASGSAIQGECRNMVIWPVFFQRRLFSQTPRLEHRGGL
jgi:hypothetical protein